MEINFLKSILFFRVFPVKKLSLMSPNLTEAKEPSIEMPELIADREVIVKKPGKESFFIFWVDLKQLSVQIRQKSRIL